MNRPNSRIDEAARELNGWFASVLRSFDPVFEMSATSAHRQAVVQAVLTRNAKVIVDSELDAEGRLYPAVCKTLAAACRKLRIETNVGHWKAALKNVLGTLDQLAQGDESLGLALGSPAAVFKSLFDEALINAGVTDRPTILVEENRRKSLGLAINWGVRFLLAYAIELPPTKGEPRDAKDVWWIRSLVEPLRIVRRNKTANG